MYNAVYYAIYANMAIVAKMATGFADIEKYAQHCIAIATHIIDEGLNGMCLLNRPIILFTI